MLISTVQWSHAELSSEHKTTGSVDVTEEQMDVTEEHPPSLACCSESVPRLITITLEQTWV